jgi:hypothetical protein
MLALFQHFLEEVLLGLCFVLFHFTLVIDAKLFRLAEALIGLMDVILGLD